ncbi:hypothetical protein EST38_g6532 [Candolleomyces aberdarensis]|uniref:Nephrocystin 3-like N-terminal domain-containing protein n=1 Tax=Candolleomyces aberdarensis TaxID=2316362 RepID=A0A4Q2DKQ2_9AGAR|nr:hypothetical protein EST38_g6532 [Candolleomyces aberdarensis]
MPPKPKKRFWSRFLSLFRSRSSQSTADRHEIASAGVGPGRSDHPSTRPAPDLSLVAHNSTPQSDGSQPPIPQPRADNEQCAALLLPSGQDLLRQPPPQPFPTLQSDDNSAVHGGTTTFFAGANGVRMRDIHYHERPVNTGGGWELLLKNISPNALHDSDARYDPPKCDKDTRVEVIGEIMDWIHDRGGPQRLLCMTGAAGSGKSALQQTTAEVCHRSGILACTYFFSASDPSRNTVKQVIPTIAYQLGSTNDTLRQCIKTAVESGPLIFSKSLRTQMSTLIVAPLQRCQGMGVNLTALPYAILIDGLDECTGEDRQAELLAAIKEYLLITGLPFRIFVASRPEWAIRTALEPGGHLCKVAYHIQLSDQYDASADMYRYLQRRFEDIGLRIGDSQWFTRNDINTLVEAASGQFIYVATVYKYVSERRASPAERLKVVLTWTPHAGQIARPFETLDVLYTNILSAANNAYEAVDTHHGRDFLLLFRAHHIHMSGFRAYGTKFHQGAAFFSLYWLGLEARAEESLVSDLRSLVTFDRASNGFLFLRLYHKSFSDFLEGESRAKDLFVSEARVYTHIAKCLMQRLMDCSLDFDRGA